MIYIFVHRDTIIFSTFESEFIRENAPCNQATLNELCDNPLPPRLRLHLNSILAQYMYLLNQPNYDMNMCKSGNEVYR